MKKNELLKLRSGTIFHIRFDDQYFITYMKLKTTIHNISKRDNYGVDNFFNLEYDVKEDMTIESPYFKEVKIVDIIEPSDYMIKYEDYKRGE